MSNFGSFQPLRNPDVDRLSYYLGQIMEPGGSFTANATSANSFFVGDGNNNSDKITYLNILGRTGNNPALRWNRTQSRLEFCYDDTTWYPLQWINAGTGLDKTEGASASLSVDVSDIIDTSAGLKETNNRIQVNLKTGGGLQFSSGEIECWFGSPTSGNILSANGDRWVSKSPDDAGVVVKQGSQTITGEKTFSAQAAFSSAILSSSYADFQEISSPGSPPANTARLFVRDNGSGKTELCAIFPTGSPVVIATEP